MLIRRQDIGALFFYYCGYSKIRNLIFRLQRKPVTRFVYFHDLPQDALMSFEAKLNFLKHDTNVTSLDDFMSGRLSVEKVNVVITFDDGFKSWLTHAVPLLRKLALPATFFISAGFVGLSKNDESAFIRSNLLLEKSHFKETTGCLTYEDVKLISNQGFTIGGHTFSHSNLSVLRDKDKLKYEIAEDKFILEALINKNINYFSYPFGAYHNPDINITEVLREVGYKGAVTTTNGFNNSHSNLFLLHRESTDAEMRISVFKARVYGNYDAVKWLRKIFRLSL